MFSALITIVVLIFSAILHEIAHGYVAERLGDPTARLSGRLSLDPRKHIDPYMSILLPLMLYIASGGTFVIGAAKPVPVDPFNLKEGRKDIALVSLAGPLTNFLIVFFFAFIFKVFLSEYSFFEVIRPEFSISSTIDFLAVFIGIGIYINLLLAIFNLIPIPPLDGSKVFSLLLPEREANAYLSLGSIGFLILMFLLLFPIGGFSLGGFIQIVLISAVKILGI